MEIVECHTLYGQTKGVPADQIHLRASAYGLVLHEDRLLLTRGRHTGRYALPGGGLEAGERLEDALKREFREETGIDIEIKQFLHFKEDFFYYDPLEMAFHGLLFFYWCEPLSLTLIEDALVDDGDIEQPRWIPRRGLTAADFQTQGEITMQLLAQITR